MKTSDRNTDIRKHKISSFKNKIKNILKLDSWYTKSNPMLSLRRLFYISYLSIKRKLHLDYSFYPPEESKVPIDVFMPTVEKDARMLNYAISGIKKNVKHPISNIYIVAPKNAIKVKEIARKNKCIFVDEASIIPLKKRDIKYVHEGENRGGWVFKMLLNLSADSICKEENILIVDSDTVFIRPQIFIYKGKPLFNLSSWYHQPYYDANRRLIGLEHTLSLSFITHYMLFNGSVLKELRKTIEQKSDNTWYSAIVKNIDTKESSGFADYEIYGDFYKSRLKLPCILNRFSNESMNIVNFKEINTIIDEKSNKFSSVSMHNYERG